MESIKTLAIIQARVSSTRLPNKVLKPILGVPMIYRQIERVLRATKIDKLIVATSLDSKDDPLVKELERRSISIFRGELNDVLDRFYQAAKIYPSKNIVRLTGDCPLADPEIIDKVIKKHYESGVDYTSNTAPPTYPDGLDVEIVKSSALKTAWLEAKLPSEREHVTLYIRNAKKRFTHTNVTNNQDLSVLRWTVDEEKDFEFIDKVYNDLYCRNREFSLDDILVYLQQNPAVMKINADFVRNEGLNKSYNADKKYLQENDS